MRIMKIMSPTIYVFCAAYFFVFLFTAVFLVLFRAAGLLTAKKDAMCLPSSSPTGSFPVVICADWLSADQLNMTGFSLRSMSVKEDRSDR